MRAICRTAREVTRGLCLTNRGADTGKTSIANLVAWSGRAAGPGHISRIAAAIAFMILGGIGGWTVRDISPGFATSASAMFASTVFDEAIAAHRTFSVETRHPVEVAANEEAHLVQWLSKRLGHRVIAPDLTSLQFRLMGGRLLPAGSGATALFMYEDDKGIRLSCYYLSVDRHGGPKFKYREQNGVGAFYWIEDGLAYAIAANAKRDLLLKVAELVYQQGSPAGARAPSFHPCRTSPVSGALARIGFDPSSAHKYFDRG